MNFKSNSIKCILSIILRLIIGFLFSMVLSNLFPNLFLIKSGNEFEVFYNSNPLSIWIVNVLAIIIFYLIWSLIQKKK